MTTALAAVWLEAAKDSTADIIQTNQVRVLAISFEAVFTIAYSLLVHFVTCLPAHLVA